MAVIDFDELGVWEGWKQNRFPPYWGRLRRFVFRRDKYRCKRCHKRFRDDKKLDCHHIVPKEVGGSDNPKNLATVCEPCHNIIHDDNRPLFQDRMNDRYREPEELDNTNGERPIAEVHGLLYKLSRPGEWDFSGMFMGIPYFMKQKQSKQYYEIANVDRELFAFSGKHIIRISQGRRGQTIGRSLCKDFVVKGRQSFTWDRHNVCKWCLKKSAGTVDLERRDE